MGGRCAIHAPSCGRQTCLLLLVSLLPPRAWPLLIKVYWALQYGMRYASALASPTFLFPTGTLWELGSFLGGPSCSLRMLFYWICPLVTPTPTLHQLGLLLPLSTCHSLTHSTLPGMAVLHSHQVLKASAQYFGLVCFFPSPLPLVHSLTLPQQVSSTIHGSLVVWVIWVFIECES